MLWIPIFCQYIRGIKNTEINFFTAADFINNQKQINTYTQKVVYDREHSAYWELAVESNFLRLTDNCTSAQSASSAYLLTKKILAAMKEQA